MRCMHVYPCMSFVAIPVCNLSKEFLSKHLNRKIQYLNDREDDFVVEFIIIHGGAGNLGVTHPDWWMVLISSHCSSYRFMKFDVFFYIKALAPCPGSPKERLIFLFNLSKVLLCERGRGKWRLESLSLWITFWTPLWRSFWIVSLDPVIALAKSS